MAHISYDSRSSLQWFDEVVYTQKPIKTDELNWRLSAPMEMSLTSLVVRSLFRPRACLVRLVGMVQMLTRLHLHRLAVTIGFYLPREAR